MKAEASGTADTFRDSAPEDRFCDLVLSGGISSGVVFPRAIAGIAQHFRLQSIGGTSVGAIAAAFAAAAEYRRRHGDFAGYSALSRLPFDLADDGATPLSALFQPARGTARLFKALALALDGRSRQHSRARAAVAGLLCAYWLFLVFGALIGALVAFGLARFFGWESSPSTFAALVGAFVGASVSVAVRIYRDVVDGWVQNNFGLCNGGEVKRGTGLALVPWMHQTIQSIAGRAVDGDPLTFGDLWNAPGFPPAWLKVKPPVRSIDLQIYTASLTHGRPFRLPSEEEHSQLYFCLDELRQYFPAAVVEYLKRVSKEYDGSHETPDGEARDPSLCGLRLLPVSELPIVVAARLSLSFPVLFSAVPLWATDYEARAGDRRPRRCWTSDGGLASNFPIHLFDAFVPQWPTFGITLHARSKHWKEQPVWLPEFHYQGQADRWNRFEDRPAGFERLFGFFEALLETAKDWNDNTLMRMPGVRDRVVRVGLAKEEGGLALRLPRNRAEALAQYGDSAARKLIEKFVPSAADSVTTVGWNEHRWVRFNTILKSLRKSLSSVSAAVRQYQHSWPLEQQIFEATAKPPLRGSRERIISEAEATGLIQLLHALAVTETRLEEHSKVPSFEPEPQPELRARPPL